MKAIHWIIAAAAFAFVQPVQAATTDPEVIIYRFPGVHDDGGATDVGVATVFFCTNFSGVIETVRFVTRQSNSTLAGNSIVGIGHLSTISWLRMPLLPTRTNPIWPQVLSLTGRRQLPRHRRTSSARR
jgi:hypothetical protein